MKAETINWEGNTFTKRVGELHSQYHKYVFGIIYNRVGRDKETASEIEQEVWVAVIGALRNFNGKSNVRTWLTGIANHKVIDYHRRNHIVTCELDIEPISDDNPQRQAEISETKRIVHDAMSLLSPRHQQVLTLKYLNDMSAKEISSVMNISEKAVNSTLDRAKLALREVMA